MKTLGIVTILWFYLVIYFVLFLGVFKKVSVGPDNSGVDYPTTCDPILHNEPRQMPYIDFNFFIDTLYC